MKLYPYQREGVMFLRNNMKAILADELGLGKTVQALTALRGRDLPAVVICPASVRLVWEAEAAKWRPELSVDIITAGKQKHKGADLTIISYSLFGKAKLKKPKTIICDEAQFLQNRTSRRTKAVTAAGKGLRVWMLTGTPIWSRPKSLYPLLKICGGWMTRYKDYAETFCNGRWVWVYTYGGKVRKFDDNGASNLKSLGQILAPYMLRRLKVNVLPELPEKTVQVIKLSADISQNEKEVVGFRPEDVSAGGIPHGPIATAIKETALIKLPLVLEHISQVLQAEDRVVVYYHNRDVGDAIETFFVKEGVVRIEGGTSAEGRRKAVQSFQSDRKRPRIFLGQNVAAGTGLTLTKARVLIFVQGSWVPSELEQVEGRVHRISQERKVLIQYLVTAGSIEEKMLEYVMEKRENANTILGGC